MDRRLPMPKAQQEVVAAGIFYMTAGTGEARASPVTCSCFHTSWQPALVLDLYTCTHTCTDVLSCGGRKTKGAPNFAHTVRTGVCRCRVRSGAVTRHARRWGRAEPPRKASLRPRQREPRAGRARGGGEHTRQDGAERRPAGPYPSAGGDGCRQPQPSQPSPLHRRLLAANPAPVPAPVRGRGGAGQ